MLNVPKSKKGGITDLAYIMVVLTVFAIIVLFGFKFMDEFNTKIQGTGVLDARGSTAVTQMKDMYPTVIDNTFLWLMIGLCIVALILAMLVAIHPVFFILYFVFLTIIIFVGGILSNVYQEMAAQPEMVNVASQLVYTGHIIQYLPMIIGVIGFVLAMVLYRTYQHST